MPVHVSVHAFKPPTLQTFWKMTCVLCVLSRWCPQSWWRKSSGVWWEPSTRMLPWSTEQILRQRNSGAGSPFRMGNSRFLQLMRYASTEAAYGWIHLIQRGVTDGLLHLACRNTSSVAGTWTTWRWWTVLCWLMWQLTSAEWHFPGFMWACVSPPSAGTSRITGATPSTTSTGTERRDFAAFGGRGGGFMEDWICC